MNAICAVNLSWGGGGGGGGGWVSGGSRGGRGGRSVVSSVQPSDLVFNPGSFYSCNHQIPRLFAVWSLLRTGSINDYVTVTSFSK